jgi:hypothetical protein
MIMCIKGSICENNFNAKNVLLLLHKLNILVRTFAGKGNIIISKKYARMTK